jgi:hypothetical protein
MHVVYEARLWHVPLASRFILHWPSRRRRSLHDHQSLGFSGILHPLVISLHPTHLLVPQLGELPVQVRPGVLPELLVESATIISLAPTRGPQRVARVMRVRKGEMSVRGERGRGRTRGCLLGDRGLWASRRCIWGYGQHTDWRRIRRGVSHDVCTLLNRPLHSLRIERCPGVRAVPAEIGVDEVLRWRQLRATTLYST